MPLIEEAPVCQKYHLSPYHLTLDVVVESVEDEVLHSLANKLVDKHDEGLNAIAIERLADFETEFKVMEHQLNQFK